MRIGFIQFQPRLRETWSNLSTIERMVLDAPAADLLVLPELATSGYALDSAAGRSVAFALESEPMRRLVQLARRARCHLVVGFPEHCGARLYNSAAMIGPGGVHSVARKSHLFWDEPDTFRPGNTGFHPHRVGQIGVGTIICFDWVFPEATGTLARRGSRIIAHPANLVLPYAQQVMPARCIENRVFAVTANRTGTEEGQAGPLTFRGRSQIVAPNGDILAAAGAHEEAAVVVTVDPLLAADKQLTPRNHLWRDRRPELYES